MLQCLFFVYKLLDPGAAFLCCDRNLPHGKHPSGVLTLSPCELEARGTHTSMLMSTRPSCAGATTSFDSDPGVRRLLPKSMKGYRLAYQLARKAKGSDSYTILATSFLSSYLLNFIVSSFSVSLRPTHHATKSIIWISKKIHLKIVF